MAFSHLKVIAHTTDAQPLLDAAGVVADLGILPLSDNGSANGFLATAGNGRVWAREPSVCTVY